MIHLGDKLYENLPRIYREEDSRISGNPLPLKRYLQILGGGFDYLDEKIDKYSTIYDIDKAPAELLPKLIEFMGMNIPYNMDDQTFRKFLKSLPSLYKMKGTSNAFHYLAREIFGTTTTIEVTTPTYVDGMLPEDWRKILIKLIADGEQLFLENKITNFERFAEIARPVNRKLVIDLTVFYSDIYLFNNRVIVEMEDYYQAYYSDDEIFTFGNISDADSTSTSQTINTIPAGVLVTGAKLTTNFLLTNPVGTFINF